MPEKAKKLSAIIAAMDSDMGTALGVTSVFARLEGPGLPGGPESIALGGLGGGEAVTGIAGHVIAKRIKLGKDGISVQKGEEIQIFGEMVNEDLGNVEMGITLEFQV